MNILKGLQELFRSKDDHALIICAFSLLKPFILTGNQRVKSELICKI